MIMTKTLLVALALFGFNLVLNIPQNANAAFGPFPNPVPGTTSVTANPGTVSFGGSTQVIVCTDDTPRTIFPDSLVSPSGVHYSPKGGGYQLQANECMSFFIGGSDTEFPRVASLSEPGTWVAFFQSGPGNNIFVDFGVSFFVIPESVIGAIALTGTSLAVLGGYVLVAKKR